MLHNILNLTLMVKITFFSLILQDEYIIERKEYLNLLSLLLLQLLNLFSLFSTKLLSIKEVKLFLTIFHLGLSVKEEDLKYL